MSSCSFSPKSAISVSPCRAGRTALIAPTFGSFFSSLSADCRQIGQSLFTLIGGEVRLAKPGLSLIDDLKHLVFFEAAGLSDRLAMTNRDLVSVAHDERMSHSPWNFGGGPRSGSL